MPKGRKASSNKKVNEISSSEDFKTVEEAVNYTGSTYKSEKSNRIYLSFKYPLYTNQMSNQNFYVRIMNFVAKVKGYKDFTLIDEEKSINIEVDCDKDLEQINNYIINGVSNYFAKEDSKIEIEKYSENKIVSLNINSDVVNEIITKNWMFNDCNIGSYESNINETKIFFDEGYNVNVIENDYTKPVVFNIVFKSKYTGSVVNNITTKNNFEEIKNILGIPTFDMEDSGVIGYKSDKIYVFFVRQENGVEISIYDNESGIDSNEFAKLVEEFGKNSAYNLLENALLDLWPDPDVYEIDNDYVLMQYSTKGVKIEFNSSNPSGITLYNNYNGNITQDITLKEVLNKEKNLPLNVYYNNEDLVTQAEMRRINRYTIDENENVGNELFYVMPDMSGNIRRLDFFSVNSSYPNFQIQDNVYDSIWADSTHFVYSVSNKGIFMVDVTTRETKEILSRKSSI